MQSSLNMCGIHVKLLYIKRWVPGRTCWPSCHYFFLKMEKRKSKHRTFSLYTVRLNQRSYESSFHSLLMPDSPLASTHRGLSVRGTSTFNIISLINTDLQTRTHRQRRPYLISVISQHTYAYDNWHMQQNMQTHIYTDICWVKLRLKEVEVDGWMA